MRVSFVFVVLLISAAPSGAALPDEVLAACGDLDAEAIFIGRPGKPAEVLISFEERIQPARERWLKAQADADKSTDLAVHIKAIDLQTEYDHLRARYPPPETYVLTPIEVETTFKGVAAQLVYLQGADEDLKPGGRYLFFNHLSMPTLDDRIMDPAGAPQPLEKAGLSLHLLKEALSTQYGGTVIGSIDYELTGDPGKPAAVAGGLAVRIASTGFMFNTSTDSDGIFLVTSVPPGQVSATPSLPTGLALVSDKSAMSVLTEGGCVSLQLRATLNGRIRGRVSGAGGKPRAATTVQLVSTAVEWPQQGRHYSTTTNDRGEFEFRAIPPGSYFVGHELIRSDLVPVKGYPPRTYYPGTSDHRAAIPIVVGNATVHEGYEFVVP